jgi:mannose-6-phosphate isomerase-like protein (cupin superfamily)
MLNSTEAAFDLIDGRVHIEPDGRATITNRKALVAKHMFGKSPEELRGYFVGVYRMTKDWTSWERHPAGDELVFVVSGKVDLVMEDEDGKDVLIALDSGAACIVPRGVWHRIVVHSHGEALHITPGMGNHYRAVR